MSKALSRNERFINKFESQSSDEGIPFSIVSVHEDVGVVDDVRKLGLSFAIARS